MDAVLQILGLVMGLFGLGMIVLGMVALFHTVKRFTASDPASDVVSKGTVADVTKLIEAISKAPLWLASVAIGDIQLWFGLCLIKGKVPFV